MRMWLRYSACALALGLLAVWVSSVFAAAGTHSAGKIVEQHADWPKGLVDLVNSDDWISGEWVNQNDYFHYRGSAADFNRFLITYGKLTDTPLTVVMHAGVALVHADLAPESRSDWELEVIRRGWGAAIDPRRPDDDPGYIVTVHVWLSNEITLDQLQVPKHVDVRSAGDIERFIERHQSQ
jgi:hypothetical protein